MLRDLLVHVSGDEFGRKRVSLAAELATRAGARLSGLHITPPADIPPRYKPSQIDAAAAQFAAELKADAQAAKAIFAEETTQHPVNAHWFEGQGDVVEGISDRARFADVVILGQGESQEPPERHPLPVAHSVVLSCGRPVLVVPAGATSIIPGKVAVAWDGSREAVRAVHDSLPLLKMAQEVHITALVTSDDFEVNSLADHLANHGITSVAKVEQVGQADERARFPHFIAEGRYDLVVMGGFSHPKWVEFIFGGTTLSTLLTSNVPVLVSH